MTSINEASIRKACNDLADILVKKNKNYGNSVEEQFNEYGMTSILIRLDDKMRRLKNLQTQSDLVDESQIDTIKDLSGYAVLGLLCLQNEPLPKLDINFNPIPYHDSDHQY